MSIEKKKTIKLIVIALLCVIIVIIGSFFRKESLDKRLFKTGFRQIDNSIYEKIEKGLSYESYLSSLEDEKENLSYLLDLELHQISKNDQSLSNNEEEQTSITWQLSKNQITGYYSLEDSNTTSYISFNYDLNTNIYECSGENEICNKMKNKSFEFINDIEDLLNKNKITIEELSYN